MKNRMWRKLLEPRIWRRIYQERLGEPLLYNLVSLFHLVFGSTRKRIEYDLVPRQPYAYCIQAAADQARAAGIERLTLIEFGVAAGAGLLNMCWIAERVAKETGVQFDIVGFDSGKGMPDPRDYRDHPEKYFTGDFPVSDREALLESLPANARLLFGEIDESVEKFRKEISCPIGFISVDVDYYWSAKQCLDVLKFGPEHYLPAVLVYADDVQDIDDNEFCGELLAIKEFNQSDETPYRKLAVANLLGEHRIFKHAIWHRQIYLAHIFDHEKRSIDYIRANRTASVVLSNPYL
jgi:hypothetical protein